MQLPGIFSTRYEEELAIVHTKTQWTLVAISMAFVCTLPLFLTTYWITWFNILCVWVIAVLGLHIMTGLCGLFSLGQASFVAVGAYVTAILTMDHGWSPWATLPISGLASGLAGLVFGIAALRIKGFYFAMATLAASYVILWLIGYLDDWTGGIAGKYVDRPSLGGIDLGEPGNYFYLALALTVVLMLLAMNIQRTRIGRSFIAIRDNDLAADVMGVNIFRHKMIALFIGSFYAGIAGWLWAHSMIVIAPNQFGLINSIWMVGMIIVGGMGTVAGAIAGTVALRLVNISIDEVFSSISSLSATISAALQLMLYSAIITVFLIFEPRGLYNRWIKVKSSYRLYPFHE